MNKIIEYLIFYLINILIYNYYLSFFSLILKFIINIYEKQYKFFFIFPMR